MVIVGGGAGRNEVGWDADGLGLNVKRCNLMCICGA